MRPRAGLIDALIQQESGGDNNAVSSKGARGLAQIMPATARNPGFGVTPLRDSSPGEQRRFAGDYMGALLDHFDGDEVKAVAAYNAGVGNVDKYGGIPPFKETQSYVKNVRSMADRMGAPTGVSRVLHALNPISEAYADETPYREPKQALPQVGVDGWEVDPDYNKKPAQPAMQAQPAQAKQSLPQVGVDGWEVDPDYNKKPAQPAMQAQPAEPAEPDNAFIDYIKHIPYRTQENLKGIGKGAAKAVATTVGNIYNAPHAVYSGIPAMGDDLVELGRVNDNAPISEKVGNVAGTIGTGFAVPMAKGIGLAPAINNVGRSALAAATMSGGDLGSRGRAAALGGALAGAGGAIQYALSPSLRGAARFKAKVGEIPTEAQVQAGAEKLADDVKPTAGMALPGNTKLLAEENTARLLNKEQFYQRDQDNIEAVSRKLREVATSDKSPRQIRKEVNEISTPIREEALAMANAAGGFDTELRKTLEELATTPGHRYDKTVRSIIAPAKKLLDYEDLQAEDVYSFLKNLDDAAKKSPVGQLSSFDNAVKSNSYVVGKLQEAIKNDLTTASGGKWTDYLKTHAEDMKAVDQLDAMQHVHGSFKNTVPLPSGEATVTPNALRVAINAKTFDKKGRDLLTLAGRKQANKLVASMNALETVRNPRVGLNGSPTASLLTSNIGEIIDNIPLVKSGKLALKMGINSASGKNAMADAILNPEKLGVLRSATKSGTKLGSRAGLGLALEINKKDKK